MFEQGRQGDILLTPVENLPPGAKFVRRGRVVLAEGETTGHAHVIEDADLYEVAAATAADVERYLIAHVPATHEEHGPIPVEDGRIYRVDRQCEYSPQAIRLVAD